MPAEIIALLLWVALAFLALVIASLFSETARGLLATILMYILEKLIFGIADFFKLIFWISDVAADKAQLRRRLKSFAPRTKHTPRS